MVNTLVFDFDGTIADSLGVGIDVYNEIAENTILKS